MKKINEMMISAYLKGMSKLNAFKDNESGEVNMVAIVLIIYEVSWRCCGITGTYKQVLRL